jgi:lysophospholipase L1-like esterase
MHARARLRRLVLPAATALALVIAGLGVWFAHEFYIQHQQLRLFPTLETRYADANLALPPAQVPRVVMIGDSRIEGWQPKPVLPGSEIVWRGIGGETTAQLVYRYERDTRGIDASIVVIQSGINDLVAGIALGKGDIAVDIAYRNLQAMIDSSTRLGAEVIVVAVVPPASPPLLRRLVWSDSIYGLVAELNARLRKLADPHVRVLAADQLLCGPSDRLPGRFAADTLHFKPAAYEVLNGALGREIEDLLHAVQ